ncbi:hypothetical protein ERO13_D11G340040v2 [Gossypium hirsutum]|uniref:Reverse transcriptase zinc-binding domain-containing protein n=2 Tax=Gossypium TaxID=3633 RepID=A0A5J5PJH1_GOSBA|nr:hypothetical protein ES319_D11G379600v1 [Gossypium barbadense]KAG4123663.1 hypothetical protein ERO13_D11G340040v2 [Gossypium hirsutum]TYI58816.1 hypothetical protein E1A91_D11G388300v1 [Gossypium mustelinum]
MSDLNVVSELIDQEQRCWKRDLITKHFSSKEAERILCIPLSKHTQEDRLVWWGEATGEYIVRSGYKRLLQGEDTSEPRHYNNDHTIFYKKLWQTDLP